MTKNHMAWKIRYKNAWKIFQQGLEAHTIVCLRIIWKIFPFELNNSRETVVSSCEGWHHKRFKNLNFLNLSKFHRKKNRKVKITYKIFQPRQILDVCRNRKKTKNFYSLKWFFMWMSCWHIPTEWVENEQKREKFLK